MVKDITNFNLKFIKIFLKSWVLRTFSQKLPKSMLIYRHTFIINLHDSVGYVNPHMPVAQKTANKSVFRRVQANLPHPLTMKYAQGAPFRILTFHILTHGMFSYFRGIFWALIPIV